MNNRIEKWNERYAGSALTWSAGPNLTVQELVDPLAPGRALDVACGEGRNALWLAEKGWTVDAFDFSPVGIEKAQRIAERRGASVNFLVADALGLDAAGSALMPASYDLVVVAFLHTSPGERSHWLPAVISRVRPGGHFLYIAHDPDNIIHGTGGPQDPALLVSAEALTAWLPAWQIIEAGTRKRLTTVESGHGEQGREAIDTVVFAKRPDTQT